MASIVEELLREIATMSKEPPERQRQYAPALIARLEENIRYGRVRLTSALSDLTPGWAKRKLKHECACGKCGEALEVGTLAWVTQNQSPVCSSCGKPQDDAPKSALMFEGEQSREM